MLGYGQEAERNMRAYLSNRTGLWNISQESGSYLALHEARAILAETEPAIYYPGHEGKEHLAYTVTTRDYEGYRVAVDCLVSSLTRFIND